MKNGKPYQGWEYETAKLEGQKEQLADMLRVLGLDEYIENEINRALDKHKLHDH